MGRGQPSSLTRLPTRPVRTPAAPRPRFRLASSVPGDRMVWMTLETSPGQYESAWLFALDGALTSWMVHVYDQGPCAAEIRDDAGEIACRTCSDSGCAHVGALEVAVAAGLTARVAAPLLAEPSEHGQPWGCLVEQGGYTQPLLFVARRSVVNDLPDIDVVISDATRAQYEITSHARLPGAPCFECEIENCALDALARRLAAEAPTTLEQWMATAPAKGITFGQDALFELGRAYTHLRVTVVPLTATTAGLWDTELQLGTVTLARTIFDPGEPVCSTCTIARPCIHDRIIRTQAR